MARELIPWEIISSSCEMQNKWLTVRRDRCKLPDNSIIDDYYIVERPDIAGVVGITSDNQVVFNLQYKHGIGEVVREICAGIIEPGEDPAQAALREFEEETGYTCHEELVHLQTVIVSPTSQNNRYHIYLARNVVPAPEKKKDMPREIINNELIPLTQIPEMIMNGEVNVLWSITSLCLAWQWLENNKV